MKNKIYRTQKLFRTPNVDEYTTILSEISINRVQNRSGSFHREKQSLVFVAFVQNFTLILIDRIRSFFTTLKSQE